MNFEFIKLIESILLISLLVFIFSTFYMIRVVKKKNTKFIRNAVTKPFMPNIDLSFFSKLRENYTIITKSRLVAISNKFSVYLLLYGYILFFILILFNEVVNII